MEVQEVKSIIGSSLKASDYREDHLIGQKKELKTLNYFLSDDSILGDDHKTHLINK